LLFKKENTLFNQIIKKAFLLLLWDITMLSAVLKLK